jgi:hypothetical protein
MSGLGLGLVGAGAANMLAHDAEDYAADDLRGLRGDLEALPPELQQAVMQTVGATSGTPRKLVMAALSGASPDEIIALAPEAPKEFKQLIKRTAELAAGAPQAAAVINQMGARMEAFEGEAAEAGRQPRDIATAVNENTAGHSPLPAILGGAGLGTGAALLHHLLTKKAVAAG